MSNFEAACLQSCDDWVNSFAADMEYEFSKSFDKKMNKLVDKMRRDKYHKLTKNAVKIILVAAILLAIATSAIAVPTMRSYFIKKFNDHFDYVISDTKNYEYVDSMTVGYIPDGFVLTDKMETDGAYSYEYENTTGDLRLSVDKLILTANMSYDAQSQEIIEINGIEYIYAESHNNFVNIVWNDGYYCYMLSGNLGREEMMKVAQSIK